MAVKKLYTESWIADIADALRTVIGGTDTYNTREMAATLATIHRGAKDVWIGTQQAYNQLGSYDVEICYIIFDNNKVMRVYAGTTILYDDPIVWDYSLPSTVFQNGLIIDTEITAWSSENILRPFECIAHITDFVSGVPMTFTQGNRFDFIYSSGNGISIAITPRISWQTGKDAFYYKFRRDGNGQLFVYDLDDNEELVHTFTPQTGANDGTSLKLGGRDQWNYANYTMEEFKFRYIT
jgi:hypothetical protein